MALFWLLCTFITCTFGNGFDLKELMDDSAPDAPLTKSAHKLDLIEWVITIPRRIYGVKRSFITRFLGKYKIEPQAPSGLWLPRYVFTKQEQIARMKPQYVIGYSTQFKAVIIWIEGTDQYSMNFDWNNINNVVPKEITLRKQSKKVDVHGGIYNAVNSELFPASFAKDLKTVITNAKRAGKPIKKIYFTGHSQGGGIATLMYILWKGNVDCKFVTAVKKYAGKETQNLLGNSEVITYGGPGIFGHANKGSQLIDGLFHSTILNIINAKDAAPMMLNGNKKKPTEPFKENDETLIDLAQVFLHSHAQAMLDEHDNKAYYGPIGKYVVVIEKKKWFGLKRDKVMLKKLDKNSRDKLYEQHLVNGADTVMKFLKTQLGKLITMHFGHVPEVGYREKISSAVVRYKEMMGKQEINIWMMIYILELISLVLVACGMVGMVFIKLSKYHMHGKKIAINMSNTYVDCV